jgi:hypothetical protein
MIFGTRNAHQGEGCRNVVVKFYRRFDGANRPPTTFKIISFLLGLLLQDERLWECTELPGHGMQRVPADSVLLSCLQAHSQLK